jgi:23S rRNA (cytidine2498-2'-O)-methyltransferase
MGFLRQYLSFPLEANHGNAMTRSIAPVGYLAPEGFLPELQQELGEAGRKVYGRLVLAPGLARPIAWVANVWLDPREIPISSISDAAKKLRAIQRNWALYAHANYRRSRPSRWRSAHPRRQRHLAPGH